MWNSIESFGKIGKYDNKLRAFAKAVINKISERYIAGNRTPP